MDISQFYNDWYARGYMDEWPIEKKQRVFKLIKCLNLTETGDLLDLGCGNGEFTGFLKKALPKWNVYGIDISSVAIENAKKRNPDCLFYLSSDSNFIGKKFDFLFTHHVLEHVENMNKIWEEINKYLKEKTSILHILPCGNEGSFEYDLSLLKKDGIEKDSGNRFYFEDRSHLRRLTTEQVNDFASIYGFKLSDSFYSNHLYGAFNWISSESPSFILNMLSSKKANGGIAALKLVCLCTILLIIKILRFPASRIDHMKKKKRSLKYYLFFMIFIIFYPFSKLINVLIENLSDWE